MHATLTPLKPTLQGLAPYSGPWDLRAAAHLLRRTCYGPRLEEIRQVHRAGLEGGVSLVLAPQSVPPPPLHFIDEGEVDVNVGETWVNTPQAGTGKYRSHSLKGWFLITAMTSEMGIREKMTAFWLNYFGISNVRDPRATYSYIKLFQDNYHGNVKDLVKRITVHPAMLEFLDGDVNRAENPNENYARELLELYTVQKGPLVKPGDYTNYTEQDVVALARAFTGWRRKDFEFSSENIPVGSYFDGTEHDKGRKVLSHCFDNAVIENGGPSEYKTVIDIIFSKKETARSICRELYRYFVYSVITDEIETSVIEPLSTVLYDSDYELEPTLTALFTSAHFYDSSVRGPIIKNPIDFMTSALRPLREYEHIDLGIQRRYFQGLNYHDWANELGMDFTTPPTVAGWKAYYDAPQYYRNWISPAILRRRFEIAKKFVSPNNHISGFRLPIDWFTYLSSFENPFSVNDLLEEIALIFLPRPLHATQQSYLKDTLLQGLPDTEWTRQCADYFSNPNDRDVYQPIHRRLEACMVAVFGMVEFQLQ